MHRYVMHRGIDVFVLRAIYERHTRQHHQYFSDVEPTIDTTREFRIVFFPWRVLITLGVGGLVFGSIAALVLNANAGYVVMMTMVGHYLVYEKQGASRRTISRGDGRLTGTRSGSLAPGRCRSTSVSLLPKIDIPTCAVWNGSTERPR